MKNLRMVNIMNLLSYLKKLGVYCLNLKGIYSEESFHLVKDIIDTCFVIRGFKKAKEGQIKCF